MLVQIYEVTSAEEASALTKFGVDHIGVLVGNGEFPREQSIEAAKRICRHTAVVLLPAILHLGASANLVRPEHVLQLKKMAKDKRGAVLDSLPCFSHMADHQPRTLQAVFPRSLSLPLWIHAPCGCAGARENRAASWIDERGPLPRS
jgi:hypothetical protein